MYFVHPQIKIDKRNFNGLFSLIFKRLNEKNLKNKLSFYFPEKKIVFTDMGRSALQVIADKLNLKNSKMLIPAYICDDVFYPFLKRNNISPVFLDISLETFNITVEEIKKKINPAIKSILVSHIYGLPNDLEKILPIAKNYNLKVIEDCAHSLGGKYKGVYLGNFGDAALFSLYKSLPIVRGGMLVCPRDWQVDLKRTSFSLRDVLSFLNCFPFPAWFFKRFGRTIAPKIKRKEKTRSPGAINRFSLKLFSYFFNNNYDKVLEKRIHLALFFQKELRSLGFEVQNPENNVFCYLSSLVPKKLENKRDWLVEQLKKHKIFVTRMWHTPIILNLEAQRYYDINLEDFPNTIEAAKRIINFPLQNFYQKEDIQKIIRELKLIVK